MIWIIAAWVWMCLVLGVLIPVGAFRTHEQERINWASATRKESVDAIESSIRYTYRIEMLSALVLATMGYGVCMALKSRRAKQGELLSDGAGITD
jgi:hypothetical protein